MSITALALSVTALIGGYTTDSEIEPITEAEVNMALGLPAAADLCPQIQNVHDSIDGLGALAGDVSVVSYLHDWADAYFIDTLETSLDGALTAEGREAFVIFLDQCHVRGGV